MVINPFGNLEAVCHNIDDVNRILYTVFEMSTILSIDRC